VHEDRESLASMIHYWLSVCRETGQWFFSQYTAYIYQGFSLWGQTCCSV